MKFKLNRHLADMLLSTGSSHLVEASYDKVWGTGILLKDQDCLNSSNWSGTGILGEMLMKIRQELLHPTETMMDTQEESVALHETPSSENIPGPASTTALASNTAEVHQ